MEIMPDIVLWYCWSSTPVPLITVSIYFIICGVYATRKYWKSLWKSVREYYSHTEKTS
jgi:hypothetical protein